MISSVVLGRGSGGCGGVRASFVVRGDVSSVMRKGTSVCGRVVLGAGTTSLKKGGVRKKGKKTVVKKNVNMKKTHKTKKGKHNARKAVILSGSVVGKRTSGKRFVGCRNGGGTGVDVGVCGVGVGASSCVSVLPGYQRCEHGKRRYLCILCKELGVGGQGLCEHLVQRCECKKGCGGGSFCKHWIKRSACPDPTCGGGGEFCAAHGRRRRACYLCYEKHPYYGLLKPCKGGGNCGVSGVGGGGSVSGSGEWVSGNTSLLEQSFRRAFLLHFPRSCVEWNKRLEIDGRRFFPDVFCRVAGGVDGHDICFFVEVDGAGHYEALKLWNRRKTPVQCLRDQVARDDKLMEWCLENGLHLFRVPESAKKDFGVWVMFIAAVLRNRRLAERPAVWLLDFERSFARLVGPRAGRGGRVVSRFMHFAVGGGKGGDVGGGLCRSVPGFEKADFRVLEV